MTTLYLLNRLVQMYKMSVWDNEGRQYLPLYNYGGDIEAYGTAEQAIDQWTDDYIKAQYMSEIST